jgi:hypothetical protein
VRRFWGSVVRPLLEILRPATIVEIGAAGGKHTRLLAAYCRESGAVVHVIDPAPQFDVQALTREGGVVVHTGLSLSVLPRLPAVDLVLLDGDHNWYTVFHELRLLQQTASEAGRPTPVMLLHDVGWPCGRRDFYYNPETIPNQFRHPWARLGIPEGQTAPSPKDGRNARLSSATTEGGPRNGVLTAIEDFLSEAGEPISTAVLRREDGLAVLVPRSRSEVQPGLDASVARVMAAAGLTEPHRSRDQLIPRVVHQVWLGSKPVPRILERYAETWREHHPDWQLRLWRDETLPPLSCQAAYEQVGDWGLGPGESIAPEALALETWRARYDIIRLEILRQFGGVIVDMDMEAIRPLDPLLTGVTAFVGLATRARRIGNQVLGAVPGHPFFEYAVQQLNATVGVASTASQTAGNGFLTRLMAERPEGVTVFPRETFYSPLTIEPPRRPDDFPKIYAVHHHLESYRAGPEAEIARYGRRLHEAQLEIARLASEQRRLKALKEKAELQTEKQKAKHGASPPPVTPDLRPFLAVRAAACPSAPGLPQACCSPWWLQGHRASSQLSRPQSLGQPACQ